MKVHALLPFVILLVLQPLFPSPLQPESQNSHPLIIKNEWETLDGRTIFLKEEILAKNAKEIMVILFRAEDCLPCVEKYVNGVNREKTLLIGVAGCLLDKQIQFLRTSAPAMDVILLDRRYELVREIRATKTPVLFKLNNNLGMTVIPTE